MSWGDAITATIGPEGQLGVQFGCCGGPWNANWLNEKKNLARYIIRASFSQERMTYHRETGQVEYKSKDGAQTKVFNALERLAAMCSHVRNKGEQMAVITVITAMRPAGE